MSKFRIYRENSPDPRKTARQNKKLYMGYAFLAILVVLTLNIHLNTGGRKSILFFPGIPVLFILTSIWLMLEMKKQSKALRKIGTLEFTRSSVTKQIGDLSISGSWNNISKIEIERHLRSLSVASNRSGSLTHILTIFYRDNSSESYIISDKSVDFRQKIGIHETLRALKISTGLEYIVKNT